MGDEFASTEDEKNETSIPSEHMLDDLPWRSNHSAFCSYSRSDTFRRNCHVSGVVARQSLLAKLTKDIVKTFGLCNPLFTYSEELNPRRYLTSPSLGVLNDGFDNVNSDLILSVNDALVNAECSLRYLVKDVLGHGTFGQVAKCWSLQRNCFVAVKIIKNQPAYYQQALVEVSILKMLNRNFDRDDQNHIVRIYDYFVHRRHLCISFELLDTNLYELIKANNFRGLSLSIVQVFSKQILLALAVMRDAGIIHCDLKPENILLCPNGNPSKIKVIDFGSACMENRTVYSYIQSRYYRSPEVVLGYQYTSAIDMWSFGCIVAELFLGLPLFPGASEFDLMSRMAKILGAQPPDHVLRDAKNTGKYFKCTGAVHFSDNGNPSVMIGRSAFEILKEEEYESRERKRPLIGKEYFSYMDLKAIVSNYPYRKNLSEEDKAKESHARLALIDFLRGLVDFDPSKRWSPVQASRHPFITGDHFTCPYVPLPDISRTVSQSMKINHNPGDGHWFAAGLSPNMMVLNHHRPRSGSLFTHSNSPNYVGDVSNNSYGENSHAFSYFSPAAGSNVFHAPPIGSSPDTRHRYLHRPNRHGVGISPPSSSGNFNHMPLGTSPSQFTPPNYTAHFSTSPARGGSSSYGSPLGKISRHRGNSSNCDEMQQPPSVLHNHVSTLPEISTWQHHTHLDNSDDTADWDPNFSDLLLHEDCIELGGLSSDLGRQMHLGPSVWSGGMGLYGHLARHLRHEETAGTSALPPPFSMDSGYGRHVSRHLQFPTQGSLSRLGQQRSDRHGGPAGARDWWQPAPPGQATHAWINYAGGGGGGLRSPKNSALRKGFSWGGKPNQVPTSGRSKEWGTIA